MECASIEKEDTFSKGLLVERRRCLAPQEARVGFCVIIFSDERQTKEFQHGDRYARNQPLAEDFYEVIRIIGPGFHSPHDQ